MISLLLFAGCLSIPDSIPNQQGTVTAADVPDLLYVASPDVPYLLWLTAIAMREEDYRTCPTLTVTDSGYTLVGDGCTDPSNVTWNGRLTYSDDGETEVLSFKDLSVEGTAGDWKVTGSILVTRTDSGSAYVFRNKLALTSMEEPTVDFWLDTRTTYTSAGAEFTYSDTNEGTVGMQGWGLAEMIGGRISLTTINGCEFGQSGFGSVALEGANRLDVRYHEYESQVDVVTQLGPRPPADTGFPVDTGTTPTDTGTTPTDTGTTPTDTGTTPTDTGTTPTGTDTTVDGIEACGCANILIGDQTISECAAPARELTYPILPIVSDTDTTP